MKLIIKNDNKDIVKNPNIKIIETTEASFANQTVFIEENDVPIIKYTDTESMYFVKDLDNLYDRKSRSEVLLNITIDNLELIGSENSEPIDSRPYKVYTALLSQTGTDDPVSTVLENTLGETITFEYIAVGNYNIISASGKFLQNKTAFFSINNTGGSTPPPTIYYTDENTLTIEVQEGGISVNDLLNLTPIKIEIYE